MTVTNRSRLIATALQCVLAHLAQLVTPSPLSLAGVVAVSLDLDLSPRRVDLLGEGFDLALRMGASVTDIATTIHAHPTLAEAVGDAALRMEEE